MQFVVLGVGRFGSKLAMSLFSKGAEVMVIDKNEEAIERIKDHVTHAVIADCTDEVTLRSLGIQDMDVAIVAIGENIETSIMATAILRRLGVPKIISRAVTRMQSQILLEVGATEVFSLEEQMGEQLASKLMAPHLLDRIELSSGHSLIEVIPPSHFIGKSLRELNLRAKVGVNVIAIKRKIPYINEMGENSVKIELNDLPSPDQLITKDDILVIVGPDEKLNLLTEEIIKEE